VATEQTEDNEGPKTLAVPSSANIKLRSRKKNGPPIAATSRTADTCAPDCPFLDKGPHNDQDGVPICYANERTRRPAIFDVAARFGLKITREALDKIRVGTAYKAPVRHLVSGDIAGPDDDYLKEANHLHEIRQDLEGWGYTHHWRHISPTDVKGWTLNASTESPAQAKEAIGKGWQVVIESPEGEELAGQRIAGRKVVACPNQSTHGLVGCADCTLCRKDTPTRPIVEFTIHARSKARKEQVNDIVRGIRNQGPVDLGMPTIRKADAFKTGFTDRG